MAATKKRSTMKMTTSEFEKDRDQFTFGVDDVLGAARQIVSGAEDFVYGGSCVYAEGGAPACLVGHVVHALDPETFRDLAEAEFVNGGEFADNLTDRGRYLPSDFWTPEAAEVMREAQRVQDDRHPWGEALDEAEARAQDLRGH